VNANFFLRQGLIHPCKMLGVPVEGKDGRLQCHACDAQLG